jgi:glutaredoxin 3
MASVTVYTTPFCGYCAAARRLLADKGVAFEEIDLFSEPERRAEMVGRARGARTVPQVFVDGTHVGGFSELHELDRSGRLAPLLAGG